MFEALKEAGLISESVSEPVELSNKTDIPLPFEKPWDLFCGYDTSSVKTYEDMNFLRRSWERLEDGELEDYEPEYGRRIWEILKKHQDKVRIFEQEPANYGTSCLEFCVTWYSATRTFELTLGDADNYHKWCKHLGQDPVTDKRFFRSALPEYLEVFEHYCEMSSVIPLYYVPNDSVLRHLNRPFKFKDIQKFPELRNLLKQFLQTAPYAPNPDKWYFVRKKYGKGFRQDSWYLKKASEDEIADLLKTR